MRHTIKKYFTGASIAALTLALNTSTSWAEGCTAVPTCDELGYNQTTCGDAPALKCPFDQTKLFCGGGSSGGSNNNNNNMLYSCQPGQIINADGCAVDYLPSGTRSIRGICAGSTIITDVGTSAVGYSQNCNQGNRPSLSQIQEIYQNRTLIGNAASYVDLASGINFNLGNLEDILRRGVWVSGSMVALGKINGGTAYLDTYVSADSTAYQLCVQSLPISSQCGM